MYAHYRELGDNKARTEEEKEKKKARDAEMGRELFSTLKQGLGNGGRLLMKEARGMDFYEVTDDDAVHSESLGGRISVLYDTLD